MLNTEKSVLPKSNYFQTAKMVFYTYFGKIIRVFTIGEGGIPIERVSDSGGVHGNNDSRCPFHNKGEFSLSKHHGSVGGPNSCPSLPCGLFEGEGNVGGVSGVSDGNGGVPSGKLEGDGLVHVLFDSLHNVGECSSSDIGPLKFTNLRICK